MVEKYFEGHTALLAGGAGYKSLSVLDGKAEAYIHVTAIKVGSGSQSVLVARRTWFTERGERSSARQEPCTSSVLILAAAFVRMLFVQ